MTLDSIIAFLRDNGVRASVQDGELVLKAPKGVLDAEWLSVLKARKQELIAALENDALGEIREARQRITPEMLPLVTLSQTEIDAVVADVSRGAANIQDIYPLAALQEGILFHHMLVEEGDPYLMRSIVAFDGRERLDRFLVAWQAVVDRHDILRTSFHWDGLSQPVQVVERKAMLPVVELTLAAEGAAGMDEFTSRTDPMRLRLDVRRAPLMAAYIARDRASGEWWLALLNHHLIGDHVTLELILGEIRLILAGRNDALPAVSPFREFVAQVRAIPESEHEAFFRAQLGDVTEPTAPFGVLDVHGDGRTLDDVILPLPAALSSKVRASARRLGMSPAVLFHVAWALVLARSTGREDVVFGTVLSGRLQSSAGADRMMGMFINTLPVRVGVGDVGALAAVQAMYRTMTDLLAHEQASLALAQRASGVAPPLPLFTTLLNYRHSPLQSASAAAAFAGMRLVASEERTNYPLMVNVDDHGEAFSINTKCVPGMSAERINAYFATALESLVDALTAEPGRRTRELTVMPA